MDTRASHTSFKPDVVPAVLGGEVAVTEITRNGVMIGFPYRFNNDVALVK